MAVRSLYFWKTNVRNVLWLRQKKKDDLCSLNIIMHVWIINLTFLITYVRRERGKATLVDFFW